MTVIDELPDANRCPRCWALPRPDDLLTPKELEAMDLTAQLTAVICGHVIGNGRTRDADRNEYVAKIHDIQKMIMGQAAARAYPQRFRLLGEGPR